MSEFEVGDLVEVTTYVRGCGRVGGWREVLRPGRIMRLYRVTAIVKMMDTRRYLRGVKKSRLRKVQP